LALAVPLSRFTPRVGGGSAFYVRRLTRMFQILTKRIEIPHFEIPWLARFWSFINPTLISDTRGRPACWLFGAACVSMLCFWYPDFVIRRSHDPYFARIATGVSMSYLPFGLIASIVALSNYIGLWRRARKCGGIASRWLLSFGLVVLLIGAAPGLFLAFCIFGALYASIRY